MRLRWKFIMQMQRVRQVNKYKGKDVLTNAKGRTCWQLQREGRVDNCKKQEKLTNAKRKNKCKKAQEANALKF